MDSIRFNDLVEKVRFKRSANGLAINGSSLANHHRAYIDTFQIRKRLGLSADEFEHTFGVSELLVKEWQKGVAKPEKPILLLLRIADRCPDIFLNTLKDYK